LARDHCEIYIRVWKDDDFKKLTRSAQGAYWMLLSQPKLNYAGVLPLNVPLWATNADDTTEDGIWGDLVLLAERGFVVYDKLAAELLIRSFFRLDVAKKGPKGVNQNLIRNALTRCDEVESPTIRAVLIEELLRCTWVDFTALEVGSRFPELATRLGGGSEGASGGGYEGGSERGGSGGGAGGGLELGARSKEQGAGSAESGARSRERGVALRCEVDKCRMPQPCDKRGRCLAS
jgi:uncharacterized membrane protein YgcG